MKYNVSVERRLYATGCVAIEADSPDAAIEAVERRITSGELQSTDVEWGDSEYEDLSFHTTGDVDDSDE